MIFLVFFVNYAQKNRMELLLMKQSEAQKKATMRYISGQYRPSVYIDKERKKEIETHFKSKGYKSFNEYIISLIDEDMK